MNGVELEHPEGTYPFDGRIQSGSSLRSGIANETEGVVRPQVPYSAQTLSFFEKPGIDLFDVGWTASESGIDGESDGEFCQTTWSRQLKGRRPRLGASLEIENALISVMGIELAKDKGVGVSCLTF